MTPSPHAQGILFDFCTRAKFRITGTDRLRFLNGQITNDARKATESTALEACVLSAKGKINAYISLCAAPNSFLVDADPELRESLQPRLERYIIADDVQIEDVTDQLSVFHVLNSSPPALPNEFKIISANRFAGLGWDIWIEAKQRDRIFRQLSEQFDFCDADCAEVFRIEQGIPRWGRELTAEIIPIEANLERRAIDYEKGCYIGQEVISRIKMSGQINKRLCGLVSINDLPLIPGMRLVSGSDERKEVGWITSAAHSQDLGKEIGLGYVKRGFNSPGSELEAITLEEPSVTARLEIVDLPFAH
jgi:folate-binding protein YgfZ